MKEYLLNLGRKLSVLIIPFFLIITANSQIKINEFSASNATQITDPDYGKYSDWIELYNAGSAAQDLNGYYLTDNFKTPDKWRISGSLVVPSKGFIVIWADGNNAGNHAIFKLSADGEELGIYSPGLALLDSLTYGLQRPNISYGRKTDGNSQWGYFQQATPNASNNTTAYEGFADNVPEFSVRGGLYTAAFSVKLFTDLGGEIRYTTDGSEPTLNSKKYVTALPITKTTIVRTRIFKPNLIAGPTVTQSYFINENSVDAKLPVVSIASDPKNFWDPAIGIYVQDFKPDWEIPINIELFENNGADRAAINECAGTKLNGLYSWQLPEKMLGIYFRKQYGNSSLGYPIINQRNRKNYKTFALRASGSDWGNTMFRDGMIQTSAIENTSLDYSGFRACVVYINGEYMGVHNIREKIDEDYIVGNHGLEPGTFDMIEETDAGHYAETGDFEANDYFLSLTAKDLTNQANYDAVAALMDITEFTEMVCTEVYSGNSSIGHNLMKWKPKDSGKWKWILMDLDRGFEGVNDNLINFYLNEEGWPLKDLMRNPNYEKLFGLKLADLLFTTFNTERMINRIEEHKKTIEAEMPNHIDRWAGTHGTGNYNYIDAIPSVEQWLAEVEILKTFAKDRPSVLLNDLTNYGFQSPVSIMISTNPANAGNLTFNGLKIPVDLCTGGYPKGEQIKLNSEAKPGYKFLGWASSSSKNIVPKESVWKYSDTGMNLGTNWISSNYNDASWKSGKAQLGYGDGDENTIVSYGSDSQNKFITTYFRKNFSITADDKKASQFTINLLCDDGAVVYLNGIEVSRTNMGQGAVDYQTLASTSISGQSESTFTSYAIDPSYFITGINTIAVEVHQNAQSSADISFDLELNCNLPSNTYLSTNSEYTFTLTSDTFLTAVYEKNSNCVVPEIISEDLTLNIDCSPYLVQDNVTITENAVLTIDPGVEIWMPKGGSIKVNGAIQANGTETQRIIFKLNPDYTNTSWGFILFKNTPKVSTLNYVTIENASKGADPVTEIAAISSYNADLVMDNLIIENVNANPIVARYSAVTLTNSSIHSKVTGDLINVKYGFATIENCTFVGNPEFDSDGIDYDGIPNGIIRNTKLYNILGNNADAIDIGEEATHIIIDSVVIFNAFDKGVSVGQRSSVVLTNSTLVNCNMGAGVKDSSWITVDHCNFYGSGSAISCYEKNLGRAGGNAIIKNSILSNAYTASYESDAKSTIQFKYCLSDNEILPSDPSNKFGNPLFADPTNYNFALQNGSPCIGTGFDGIQSIDMGAKIPFAEQAPLVMIYQIYVNAEDLNFPEFITLYNPSNERVDLSNYTITKGITLTIPEGTYIESKDIIYLTDNATPNNWIQKNKQVVQWESGHLSNNGESIQLAENHGIVIDYVNYKNDGLWPAEGFSSRGILQLKSENLDNHFPESWTSGTTDLILDTNALTSSERLSVYPNPASSEITIKGFNSENKYIEIYSLSGQMIGKSQLNRNGLKTLDISDYPNGMFLIRVGENVQKLLKVN